LPALFQTIPLRAVTRLDPVERVRVQRRRHGLPRLRFHRAPPGQQRRRFPRAEAREGLYSLLYNIGGGEDASGQQTQLGRLPDARYRRRPELLPAQKIGDRGVLASFQRPGDLLKPRLLQRVQLPVQRFDTRRTPLTRLFQRVQYLPLLPLPARLDRVACPLERGVQAAQFPPLSGLQIALQLCQRVPAAYLFGAQALLLPFPLPQSPLDGGDGAAYLAIARVQRAPLCRDRLPQVVAEQDQ